MKKILFLPMVLFFVGCSFIPYSIFTPKNVDMWNCAGSEVSNGGTTNCRADIKGIVYSSDINIGEYNIKIETSEFRNEPIYSGGKPVYSCELNMCNGQASYVDGDSCQHWKVVGYSTTVNCGGVQSGGCACSTSGDCGRDANCAQYGGTGWSITGYSSNGCPTAQKSVDIPEVTCGGKKATNQQGACCGYQICWEKYTVYKNNELLYASTWSTNQRSFNFNTKTESEEAGLNARFNSGSYLYAGSCRIIENQFKYIVPNDAFSFNVSVLDYEYTVNENINPSIQIKNDFEPVKANVCIVYNIPYPSIFGDKETSDISCKVVDLVKGTNIVLYDIPTSEKIETLYVTPKIEILMEGSKFTGVNGVCYGGSNKGVNLNTCEYISLGNYEGDKTSVSIKPQQTIPEENHISENQANVVIEESTGTIDKIKGRLYNFVAWIKRLFYG